MDLCQIFRYKYDLISIDWFFDHLDLWKKAGNIDKNTERIPPVFYEIASLNEAI
jgi:hypothetical protein